MRTSTYLLAALTIAGFATVSAQNTQPPATPSRMQTPARQPTTSPPADTPMPSPRTSPTPARPAQPAPDARIDPNNRANNPQQRVPPASRGVGQTGRPDCSKLRGLEKSECERRDTTRDDLPAGVTPKQPEK